MHIEQTDQNGGEFGFVAYGNYGKLYGSLYYHKSRLHIPGSQFSTCFIGTVTKLELFTDGKNGWLGKIFRNCRQKLKYKNRNLNQKWKF